VKLTRTQRLIRIVQILHSGRKCNVDALAEEFGVSRRSIFRDMNVLRDAGLACYFDEEAESYTIDHAFFLKPVDLTMEEGLALMLMTRKLADERIVPAFASAVSAGLKIESAMPDGIRRHCGDMMDGVDFSWSQVSDADAVSDVIIRFQESVASHEKMRIKYDSYYDKSEIETTIRPYCVMFRNRGWYVIGYSERHRQVRTFKLERVLDATPLGQKFRPAKDFSLEEYYGNAWNMVRGQERFHVEVHFSAMVAGNVEEVAWHATQRTRRRSDGSLVFEADVDGIDEIAWWILGYGDQAVVTEPECLRSLIISHAEKTIANYKNHISTPDARR
jgi:predicted DNA-binding transcriptional regulator YafY